MQTLLLRYTYVWLSYVASSVLVIWARLLTECPGMWGLRWSNCIDFSVQGSEWVWRWSVPNTVLLTLKSFVPALINTSSERPVLLYQSFVASLLFFAVLCCESLIAVPPQEWPRTTTNWSANRSGLSLDSLQTRTENRTTTKNILNHSAHLLHSVTSRSPSNHLLTPQKKSYWTSFLTIGNQSAPFCWCWPVQQSMCSMPRNTPATHIAMKKALKTPDRIIFTGYKQS